ncbi:uncharacterized protein GIQ15_00066 [Arthroderma uncinatum]|uniref:uncharacterized protein n=1 Tax=Arthroderma uncinatum TaxID=74035 RepID=UPI00144AC58D|nr:uncharacterized protein GIQ15_00066 [Arthroderma uncinatum]KAF3490549.1 hypothetical protein GIQ15_00066 [Arthroderma uncinatum]
MLVAKVLTLLSVSAAALAAPGRQPMANDSPVPSTQEKRAALVDCPEGWCLDNSTYCDAETRTCKKKGPGPCGAGQCISHWDGPRSPMAERGLADSNCTHQDCNMEACLWIKQGGKHQCVPKKTRTSNPTKTRGGRVFKDKRTETRREFIPYISLSSLARGKNASFGREPPPPRGPTLTSILVPSRSLPIVLHPIPVALRSRVTGQG